MAQIILSKGVETVPTVSDTDDFLSKEGAQTVTAGTDLSGLATGVANFTVLSGISTTSTDPFHMAVTGTYRNAGTGGTIYVRPKGTGADDINRAIHSGAGTTHFVTGGAVDSLDVLAGTVRIDAAVDVNTLNQTGGTVVQHYNATENDTWRILGGQLNTERGLGGSGVIGEDATVIVKKRNTDNTPPIHDTGTLTIQGKLYWNGGNMNTVEVLGNGMIDLSGVDQDITIASMTMTAAARQRSILESRNPSVAVTITTLTVVGGDAETDGKKFAASA